MLEQLLEDMQNSAIAIGKIIEQEEGYGTKTVAMLEEYCELLYAVSYTHLDVYKRQRLYNMDQLKDRLLLMRAAREAGYGRLEELIRQKCSGIELQCFDKAMEQHGKKAET